MIGDALTDPLLRQDYKSQELGYNNNTDRFKMELPEKGDLAASGCLTSLFPQTEHTWAQLTAPSSTSSLEVIDNSKHTFQYVVDSIDTNVKVTASGSLDNANWFNLDANESLTTHTSNGTYGMTFDGMTKYVLFSFMEETGGTNATIDAKYLGSH